MTTPPISISLSLLLSLNTALPTSYRTPSPFANSTHVIQQAIQCLKGSRIASTIQAQEIDALHKELTELKSKHMAGNTHANPDLDFSMASHTSPSPKAPSPNTPTIDPNSTQTPTLQTLTVERNDYQFCITQLIMYITGEGSETRPVINFAKLREVLQAARGGGWTLKAVGEAVEREFPADGEIIRKREEGWEGVGKG